MPSALAVGGTYLIFSEVSYLYTPAVGYVMAKAGITLSDVAYTRPRQSTCVIYYSAIAPAVAADLPAESRPDRASRKIAAKAKGRADSTAFLI